MLRRRGDKVGVKERHNHTSCGKTGAGNEGNAMCDGTFFFGLKNRNMATTRILKNRNYATICHLLEKVIMQVKMERVKGEF